MKKIISALIISSSALFADYSISYKGVIIGTLQNFATVKDGFIMAKITNDMIYAMNGFNDYYVIHKKHCEPSYLPKNNTFFKEDNKKLIEAIAEAINDRPSSRRIVLSNDKNDSIDIGCYNDTCSYRYRHHSEIQAAGKIIFNQNNKIVFVEDKINEFIIRFNS
jgi:hypothetical protein